MRVVEHFFGGQSAAPVSFYSTSTALLSGVFFALVLFQLTACSKPEQPRGRPGYRDHMVVHTKKGVTCENCHGALPESLEDKSTWSRKKGFFASPGITLDQENTCAQCHFKIHSDVNQSLMATMHGAIGVTRFAMNEKANPGGFDRVLDLKPDQSLADDYFQDLCIRCHLNHKPKSGELKSMGEDLTQDPVRNKVLQNIHRRGGGCLACHLEDKPPQLSSITKTPPEQSCAGCHSGSLRISLSYYGLSEIFNPDEHDTDRLLQVEKRFFQTQSMDIHAKAEMKCTDCHGKEDVMGTGLRHPHKSDGVVAQCSDCHINHPVTPALEHHNRLNCETCHSRKTPSCDGCHIRKEKQPDGTAKWVEFRGKSYFDDFALGLYKDRIRPFLPAMVFTYDKKTRERSDPLFSEKALRNGEIVSSPLYAPGFAHTITAQPRNCVSCHKNTKVFGIRSGTLAAKKNGWSLSIRQTPDQQESPQVAFFHRQIREPGSTAHFQTTTKTTRPGAAPLDETAVRKLLQGASCLECHDGNSRFFQDVDIDRIVKNHEEAGIEITPPVLLNLR